MLLATTLAFTATTIHGVEIDTPQSALRFLEENVYGLLRIGDFPEFFGLSAEKIERLGCDFAPKKVYWGREVGYQCVRDRSAQVVPEASNYIQCTDMFSSQITVICPDKWVADCAKGCEIPKMTRRKAVEFWEMTIADIIKTGYVYTPPAPEFIKNCGCQSDNVRLIEYGSGVGFDCILKTGWRDIYDKETCWSGHHLCRNPDTNEDLLTFCPIGYIPTCSGCLPGVPGLVVDHEGNIDDSATTKASIGEQLGWLVDVLAGYTRQSQMYIGWMPEPTRALACACKSAMKPVEYGRSIGYVCEIWDVAEINHEHCRQRTICNDENGNKILHMCPDGFLPSCEKGCSFPWNIKQEL